MILLNENFVYRKIYSVDFLIPIKKNDISDDAIFLNETATLIFRLCDHIQDVHTLALKVFSNFIGADENEVVPELETYIQGLINEGLLVER